MAKMCNEGIGASLNILFRGQARPSFYLGLFTAPTTEPAVGSSIANLTEPSGNGYVRLPLADADWTVATQQAVNLMKTFAAAGGVWGDVYGWFICDCLSGTAGKLWAVGLFPDGPYNVLDGGQVNVTPEFTMS
jgi:hypothetical protein